MGDCRADDAPRDGLGRRGGTSLHESDCEGDSGTETEQRVWEILSTLGRVVVFGVGVVIAVAWLREMHAWGVASLLLPATVMIGGVFCVVRGARPEKAWLVILGSLGIMVGLPIFAYGGLVLAPLVLIPVCALLAGVLALLGHWRWVVPSFAVSIASAAWIWWLMHDIKVTF